MELCRSRYDGLGRDSLPFPLNPYSGECLGNSEHLHGIALVSQLSNSCLSVPAVLLIDMAWSALRIQAAAQNCSLWGKEEPI